MLPHMFVYLLLWSVKWYVEHIFRGCCCFFRHSVCVHNLHMVHTFEKKKSKFCCRIFQESLWYGPPRKKTAYCHIPCLTYIGWCTRLTTFNLKWYSSKWYEHRTRNNGLRLIIVKLKNSFKFCTFASKQSATHVQSFNVRNAYATQYF